MRMFAWYSHGRRFAIVVRYPVETRPHNRQTRPSALDGLLESTYLIKTLKSDRRFLFLEGRFYDRRARLFDPQQWSGWPSANVCVSGLDYGLSHAARATLGPRVAAPILGRRLGHRQGRLVLW